MILVSVICITACNNRQGSSTEGLEFTLSEDGSYYILTGFGQATTYDIICPDIYNGLPVKEIGNKAFDETSLNSIVIPNTVTRIGDYAFYRCTSLKSIEIPDSVTSFGDYAFYACTSLKNVKIPHLVTSIGSYAFSGCISFTSIEIPDSVTSIGDWAFLACSFITNVVIPDSVISIGDGAFYNCTSLINVVIPDSVISIGERAFSGCKSLTIYCDAESKPSEWDSKWNCDNRPVVWGYKGN